MSLNHLNRLNLLIVHASSEAGHEIYRRIRRLSVALHWQWVADTDEAKHYLTQNPTDVCLYHLTEADEVTSVSKLHQQHPETTMLVLCESYSESLSEALIGLGIRSVIDAGHPSQIQAAVARELECLQLRQSLADMRSAFFGAEQRAQTYLQASSDPMACLVDGLHSEVNHAYVERFGAANAKAIAATPLLNLIAEADRQKVKQWLQHPSTDNLNACCLTLHGDSFHSTLQRFEIHGEQEHSVLLVLRGHTQQMHVPPLPTEQNDTHKKQLLAMLDSPPLPGHKRTLVTLQVPHAPQKHESTALSQLIRANLASNEQFYPLDDGTFSIVCEGGDDSQVLDSTRSMVNLLQEQTQERPSLSVLDIETAGEAEVLLERALQDLSDPDCHFNLDGQEEERQAQWHDVLLDAVQKNRFEVVQTPLVCLSGSKSDHYYLGLDYSHNDTRLRTRNIHQLAALCGLNQSIDRWLCLRAIRQLVNALSKRQSLCLWLPLSAHSLYDESYPDWLSKTLDASGLESAQLVLSFHRQAIEQNPEQAQSTLHDLNLAGVRLLFEDISMSKAAHHHLIERLGPEFISVPSPLVRKLPNSYAAQQQLQREIEIASELEVATIAPGVDDTERLSLLWQSGVEFMMGKFLSHTHSQGSEARKQPA